jgi:hypothetical protein
MKTLQQTVQEARTRYYSIALQLLRSTDLTITEIAEHAGVSVRQVGNLATTNGIWRQGSHKIRKNSRMGTENSEI